MTLTGPYFLWIVVLLTVAVFAGAIVVLPHVSGFRPVAIAYRALVLFLVNLMVLLSAAVILNDKYAFYADWTDVRGALFGGRVRSTAHAGGAAAQAANTRLGSSALGPSVGPLPPLPPGAGSADRVLRFQLTGPRSGLHGFVLVTLPEGYTHSANATRRYPVLETFPGYPADPSQWTDSMRLGAVLDNAVAAHSTGAVITLSPLTEFPPGIDTECVNGTGNDPMVETWLTRDVPDWAQRTFRVQPGRASWATLGLSAGGWCAAMATMLHPDRYATGIAMGGYFKPEFSAKYTPFGSHSSQARRYDLVALARRAPPPVALWLETSHSDKISYASTAKLLAATRAPLSIQALVLTHAGHRLSLWSAELPAAISWLGKNIPGFAYR